MPQGWQWLWLFGVGFWAAVSHMCMTYALAFAPASTLAPLHYFEIVVAVILRLLVFGDLPNG
jgi:drug/metabolite transporter (DMT)-like permease